MTTPARPGGNTWTDEVSETGDFVREQAEFRDWIRGDGSTRFAPEADRYHLYVSFACPWAHRTLIARSLLGLEGVIGVSVVHPLLDSRGWRFEDRGMYGDTSDTLYGEELLRHLYDRTVSSDNYQGRITVPVLWDKETGTIVNNESAEIIRMFSSELGALGNGSIDLYPAELSQEIDELNEWIYESVNNGVYRCGFATKQGAYERAFDELFGALDQLEERLSDRRYLTGKQFTEADIRLFTTLVRFDPVYHNHFRCNLRKMREYPNLWGFVLDIAKMPGVAATIQMDHIKAHYYRSHTTINPSQIVPVGPEYDLTQHHNRDGVGLVGAG